MADRLLCHFGLWLLRLCSALTLLLSFDLLEFFAQLRFRCLCLLLRGFVVQWLFAFAFIALVLLGFFAQLRLCLRLQLCTLQSCTVPLSSSRRKFVRFTE